jgi:hypothetical protein
MEYNAPYGEADPNAPYVNGNPTTGTRGSIPPAASIEYPQRELVNFITDAGLVPDNGDLHQLGRSVQTGHVIYGVDSGAANILSIALTPPLVAYIDGMHVLVRVAASNTGPAVLSINGLAGKNIIRRGGAALQPGDLPGTYMALLVYNGPHGNFELYGASFAPASFVPILSANSNLYVNAATGDDALYDGTTATISGPHGPFKTIMRAVNETFKYGPSVYTMTINVSAGTYPEAVQTPNVIGPTTIIKGAGISATFVTGANNAMTFSATNANQFIVQDLQASTGTGLGPPCCFSAASGGKIYTNNTASGFCYGYVWNAYSGYVTIGNHTFMAGGSCMLAVGATFGGNAAFAANALLTFTGSFSISFTFAWAASNGSIQVGMPGYQAVFANPGFVAGAGTKFTAHYNGVINTQGQSISYFPGVNAGTTDHGGWYA